MAEEDKNNPAELFEQVREKVINHVKATNDPQWVIAYMLANVVDGLRYFAEKLCKN